MAGLNVNWPLETGITEDSSIISSNASLMYALPNLGLCLGVNFCKSTKKVIRQNKKRNSKKNTYLLSKQLVIISETR